METTAYCHTEIQQFFFFPDISLSRTAVASIPGNLEPPIVPYGSPTPQLPVGWGWSSRRHHFNMQERYATRISRRSLLQSTPNCWSPFQSARRYMYTIFSRSAQKPTVSGRPRHFFLQWDSRLNILLRKCLATFVAWRKCLINDWRSWMVQAFLYLCSCVRFLSEMVSPVAGEVPSPLLYPQGPSTLG